MNLKLKNLIAFEALQLVTFVIALVISAIYLFFDSPPWKTIDPTDSRFKAESFEFRDYPLSEDLDMTLRIMFPIGTSKEFVDKILYHKQTFKSGHLDNEGESVGFLQSDPSGVSKFRNYAQPIENIILNGWVYLYRDIFPFRDNPTISIFVYYDRDNKVVEIIRNGKALLNSRK
jgi:hypothetical protein